MQSSFKTGPFLLLAMMPSHKPERIIFKNVTGRQTLIIYRLNNIYVFCTDYLIRLKMIQFYKPVLFFRLSWGELPSVLCCARILVYIFGLKAKFFRGGLLE